MQVRRSFMSNSLALMANRLTQSISTFVLVMAIAHLLGAYALGQYTLAFSYYMLMMTFASAGFKLLITRELARNPAAKEIYLVNGTVIQLLVGLLIYGVLFLLIGILPYSPDTSTVCWLMGLMLVPFSLSNITEAIFQAEERMDLIALSTIPIYLLRLGLMIAAMRQGFGLLAAIWILVLSEIVILLIEWSIILRQGIPKWRMDWQFMGQMLRDAYVLILIDGVAILKTRIQVIVLSFFGGEVLVGVYGALMQLMQPLHIVINSLVQATFPRLSQVNNVRRQRQIVEKSVSLLLSAALPFLVVIAFFGGELLLLIYRDPAFANAGSAFAILALTGVAIAFTRPLSFVLVANGHERINLTEVLVTAGWGTVVSWLLIAQWRSGLTGAVIGDLLMEAVAALVYIFFFWRLIQPLNLIKAFQHPILISGAIALLCFGLKQSGMTLFPALIILTAAYSLLMVGRLIQLNGGLEKVIQNRAVQHRAIQNPKSPIQNP
jgi:O-antigen/teichoic acid export membrane protein